MDFYNEKYLPSIIKIGKATCLLGAVICFVPAIIVTFGFGLTPTKAALISVLVAQFTVNVAYWIIEPISFFPILGVSGTYIAFLSGNISNLRVPCAVATLKATDTKAGTKEASVLSSIGVSVSVFVNIAFLTLGVLVGVKVIGALPASITESLNYLLPALIGGCFSMIAVDDLKSSICAVILGCGTLWLYNQGMLNWFPVDPFIPCLVIPIFGTLAFSYFTYKEKEEK